MQSPPGRRPDSTSIILTLPGAPAISEFRLDKRFDEIRRPFPQVTALASRYVHFVELARALDEDERDHLDALLRYGPTRQTAAGLAHTLWVLPRFGTISPWSSKATDIARVCGLEAVLRIERGVAWSLEAKPALDAAALRHVGELLHDRMTETVVHGAQEARRLFDHAEPAPGRVIDVLGGGLQALIATDAEMGLALTLEEMEYLLESFRAEARNPTDAELMMFAQANSEHCRHKIFNATWTVDGEAQPKTLFDMIRNTHARSPDGVLSAYRDNAAVIAGRPARRFFARPEDGRYAVTGGDAHIILKVETHNHPTAISPFPGAATGSGGEIRDEGATGRGAKPKAGLTGFSVSDLHIPGFAQPWEQHNGKPERIASALSIMLEGPIGGASFNNEFGRPNLLGYFRTFEQRSAHDADEVRGYHKPIMIAGGLGNIMAEHVEKLRFGAGAKVIVLGGPAMLIGLGGGAASSMASGQSSAELDFASVQRGNPEIQRRVQEVIDACWARGTDNPILSIHDVGAGGLSNAVPEILDQSDLGGLLELREIPKGEPGMSPMGIWCNEAQERYVLTVAPERLAELERICRRERCPFAVLGEASADGRLVVNDRYLGDRAVDMSMETLLGKTPRMHRDASRLTEQRPAFDYRGIDIDEAVLRVLSVPAVADKTFLVTIGDRSVGGLVARDQMIGPWQVPVSDVACTTASFDGYTGEAMAMGERTPLALLDAPASGRIAVGEALTNIVAADVAALGEVRLSANWMAASGHPGEDAALFDTVYAVGEELCPALGIAIPVGKDSLSLRTTWQQDGRQRAVVSPLSLIVSAFAPVDDVRRTLTPQLRPDVQDSALWLIDLGAGRNRLGGSCFAQAYGALGDAAPDLDDPRCFAGFFAAITALRRERRILAYHDRSDGGLIACLCEMAFAGGCGFEVTLPSGDDPHAQLFAEELGAVLQICDADVAAVHEVFARHGLASVLHRLGEPDSGGGVVVRSDDGGMVFSSDAARLRGVWSATTHRMQALRDNPECAREEYEGLADTSRSRLYAALSFDPAEDVAAPYVSRGARPRLAVLREQGVNGQVEMAAAFDRAGFDAFDVHMSDVIEGRTDLRDFHALAACGGFSFGDVLGAGEGWAKSILYNARARDSVSEFLARADTLTLGVCNGCQMLAALKALVPGAAHWPRFVRNRSEQFEARLGLVRVLPSPSLVLAGMQGSIIPVAVSHGEGRCEFAPEQGRDAARGLVAIEFVDGHGERAARYPQNPNGSPDGITGLTSEDGRVTIMMPHPERVFRSVQLSWHPEEWGEDSAWMRMFRNARIALG